MNGVEAEVISGAPRTMQVYEIDKTGLPNIVNSTINSR